MNSGSRLRFRRSLAYATAMTGVTASFMAALAPAALAAPATGSEVVVRGGDHPGFGRIVFDMPAGASVETAAEGSRLLLVFSGADRLGQPPTMPRNVVALRADGATVTLALQPGAKAKTVRLGNRLIVDVADATGPSSVDAASLVHPAPGPAGADAGSAGPVTPPSRAMKPGRPAVTRPVALPTQPDPQPVKPDEPIVRPGTQGGETRQAAGPVVSSEAVSAIATQHDTGPSPVQRPEPGPSVAPALASEAPAPVLVEQAPPAAALPQTAPEQTSVVLPVDATVGAAAFRREGLAVIVLDRRVPLAPPSGLPGAVVVPGAVTTTLHFPLASDRQVQLARAAAGWTVAIVPAASPGEMDITTGSEGVVLPMSRQGRPVTIVDPVSGGTLMVGTSLADGVKNAVGMERRGPEYVIAATWLGVAIEPLSDREDLRAGQGSFLLRGAAPTTLASVEAGEGRLDLPNEPAPALLNRMKLQLASAAEAQPRARTPSRLAAAQAMIALGLGVEAEALLNQTASDDPQAGADARVAMLTAVAAVLSGRLDEADALDDPRLQDVPEARLWRGLRDRRLGRDTAAARELSTYRTAIANYPEPLRRLLWPDVAEAAVEAGVVLSPDQMTPYASALLLERNQRFDDALSAWHALANSADRLDSVRASRRAIELELATGRINAGQASDRVEALAIGWRGDRRELELRLRTAELRAAAGHWRGALDLLRSTDALFAGQHDEIRRAKTAVFEAMLATDGAGLSPMDLVVLASDFADCVPDDGSGAKLAALLADKLTTLDLSARAIPVLQGLMKAAPPGPTRAEFGARLAKLLLEADDDKGALAALQASAATGLPPDTTRVRAVLAAKARAAGGDVRGAVDALEQLASSEADDLRATLLAKAGDWRGSLAALSDLAARDVPSDGPLSPAAQRLLVRQATAAAQASDVATLRMLQRQLPRMAGAQADLLRVLTEAPITSTRELPRAATELALARNIPQQIQAIGKR